MISHLTNSSGVVVQKYGFDAFGNLIAQTGSVTNNYRFQTKELHPQSNLVYFGARYYDPRIGRFITLDPSGMADGPNLYCYCLNDPINLIDAWGLCADEPGLIDVSWQIDLAVGGVALGPKLIGAGLSAGTKSVLYFGPNAWRLATASSGVPIFKTPTGMAMNWIQNSIGIRLPRVIWDAASAIYAAGARGTVQVFSTLSEYSTDYSSAFYRVEAPIMEVLGKAEMIFK